MKTIEQRNQIIAALLPLLNEMQKCEGTSFIAELKQPITFSDLMALSDGQLKALQKLVDSTRSAKKSEKNTKIYDSLNKPNYVITDKLVKKPNIIF